jgi:hypothetical protein
MVNETRKTANRVFQRQHKEKLYAAGFKQKIIWVKRDETDSSPVLDLTSFLNAFRQLIRVIPREKRPRLFRDILSMTEYEAHHISGENHGK